MVERLRSTFRPGATARGTVATMAKPAEPVSPAEDGPADDGPDVAHRRTVLVLFVSLLAMTGVAAFAVGGLISASGHSAPAAGPGPTPAGTRSSRPFAAEVGALAVQPDESTGPAAPAEDGIIPPLVSLTPRVDATGTGTGRLKRRSRPTPTGPTVTPTPTGPAVVTGPSQILTIPITPRSAPRSP
jgi:hypothetical protein